MSSKALIEKNIKIRTKTLILRNNLYVSYKANYLLPFVLNIKTLRTNKVIKRLCMFTGRSRGCLKKFHVSRIMFRHFVHIGAILGVQKASW